MTNIEYFLIVKTKGEFQKLLNQWKHEFEFEILWMNIKSTNYQISRNIDEYHALIKRWKKCPHGTFGGWEHCMACRPELTKKE